MSNIKVKVIATNEQLSLKGVSSSINLSGKTVKYNGRVEFMDDHCSIIYKGTEYFLPKTYLKVIK